MLTINKIRNRIPIVNVWIKYLISLTIAFWTWISNVLEVNASSSSNSTKSEGVPNYSEIDLIARTLFDNTKWKVPPWSVNQGEIKRLTEYYKDWRSCKVQEAWKRMINWNHVVMHQEIADQENIPLENMIATWIVESCWTVSDSFEAGALWWMQLIPETASYIKRKYPFTDKDKKRWSTIEIDWKVDNPFSWINFVYDPYLSSLARARYFKELYHLMYSLIKWTEIPERLSSYNDSEVLFWTNTAWNRWPWKVERFLSWLEEKYPDKKKSDFYVQMIKRYAGIQEFNPKETSEFNNRIWAALNALRDSYRRWQLYSTNYLEPVWPLPNVHPKPVFTLFAVEGGPSATYANRLFRAYNEHKNWMKPIDRLRSVAEIRKSLEKLAQTNQIKESEYTIMVKLCELERANIFSTDPSVISWTVSRSSFQVEMKAEKWELIATINKPTERIKVRAFVEYLVKPGDKLPNLAAMLASWDSDSINPIYEIIVLANPEIDPSKIGGYVIKLPWKSILWGGNVSAQYQPNIGEVLSAYYSGAKPNQLEWYVPQVRYQNPGPWERFIIPWI